jgi:hypothetical protein
VNRLVRADLARLPLLRKRLRIGGTPQAGLHALSNVRFERNTCATAQIHWEKAIVMSPEALRVLSWRCDRPASPARVIVWSPKRPPDATRAEVKAIVRGLQPDA